MIDLEKVVEKVYSCNQPNVINIPKRMGKPAKDQFEGFWGDKLAEIAGRVCYDSFGKGRNSVQYAAHILEVKHLSVLEHVNFTIEIDVENKTSIPDFITLFTVLLNRPGVFSYFNRDERTCRITMNLRSLHEWKKWDNLYKFDYEKILSNVLRKEIWREVLDGEIVKNFVPKNLELYSEKIPNVNLVQPEYDEEKWYTFWFCGSRGFSHELVRHGDRTAISQRSTRYVDESCSMIRWHPLILKYCDVDKLDAQVKNVSSTYSEIVDILIANEYDRKSARGAARGILPNALETQVVFSASLAQWNRIIKMRCNKFADAEIRYLMDKVKDIIYAEEYTK